MFSPTKNFGLATLLQRIAFLRLSPYCEAFSMWYRAMGGGTFFKVGGTSACWKEITANFVVWIGNCGVTSIEIWRHYIYIIWRSKLHYFRQNYIAMKTHRWTTWNSNRLLQGRPRSSASLGLIIRFILTDWIKPFDVCVTEISICVHSAWHYRCPGTLCYVTINEKLSW